MAILTASNVGRSFGDYDIFSGVNVSVPSGGRVGLIGPNGVGKTTLLRILAGREAPSAGHVHLAGDALIGYLSQESSDAFAGKGHTLYDEMLSVFDDVVDMEMRLGEMESDMAAGHAAEELLESYSTLQLAHELAGGYEYEMRIQQVLTGLGFGRDTWTQHLPTFSGGQKTRALLARLLLEKPDMLILDEPTNHLDVEAIEWLENTLANWEGAVLIVSHDRYFLDRAVNNIWEMSPGGIESYRGNYSAYLMQRQHRWERQQLQYEAMKERLAKELDFIKRNISSQRTQMAQGKLSRVGREVEAIRVGGLSVISQLNSKGWLRLSQELNLKRPPGTVSELEAAIKSLPAPRQPPIIHFGLDSAHRSGNIVLQAADLEIGFPDKPLFTIDALELHRLETAALIGPNGSGKTTFLRTILGEQPPLAGALKPGAGLRVGYFAQVQEALNPENTVLDELLRHKQMMISEARNYLARFLFRGDEVFNKVAVLSGGERARLALAILVLEEANFLLLDEPTNHLDIPSQEMLQVALEQFDGTILLVTHDRYLVDRLASQIWDLKPASDTLGRLDIFNGSYQAYLQTQGKAAESAAQISLGSETQLSSAVAGTESVNDRPLSKNEQRKREAALASLESAVDDAETRLAQLSQALQEATVAGDVGRIQQLGQEYAGTEQRLAELLQQWEVMAHESATNHRSHG